MEGYFLTSRHGNCGSSVMFHNKDEHGYGTNIDNLEVYTAEQAQKHHESYGRDSLPLLVSKVREKSTIRVDMQYPDIAKGLPKNELDICVVSIAGSYDGNDMQFMSKDGGYTFNLDEAAQRCIKDFEKLGVNRIVWSYSYIKNLSRRTFQAQNINTRSLCRGVKLLRKKNTSDSGKTRMNCPSCGKIHWQYNPYDFEGCNDLTCSESRSRFY